MVLVWCVVCGVWCTFGAEGVGAGACAGWFVGVYICTCAHMYAYAGVVLVWVFSERETTYRVSVFT